jgi:type II secretory pathway component PulM
MVGSSLVAYWRGYYILGLVRETVIVSGSDVLRCFSGMTVLNWKPADESLEQARNKEKDNAPD